MPRRRDRGAGWGWPFSPGRRRCSPSPRRGCCSRSGAGSFSQDAFHDAGWQAVWRLSWSVPKSSRRFWATHSSRSWCCASRISGLARFPVFLAGRQWAEAPWGAGFTVWLIKTPLVLIPAFLAAVLLLRGTWRKDVLLRNSGTLLGIGFALMFGVRSLIASGHYFFVYPGLVIWLAAVCAAACSHATLAVGDPSLDRRRACPCARQSFGFFERTFWKNGGGLALGGRSTRIGTGTAALSGMDAARPAGIACI